MGYAFFGVLILLIYVVLVVLAIVGGIFQYISYYDLFCSSKPENATLFLVLGIIFPVTLPFFLFVCRKCDNGMPPRKVVVPQVIVQAAEVAEEETFVVDNEDVNA